MKLAILSMLHALQIGMAVFGFYENKQTHPTGFTLNVDLLSNQIFSLM